MLLGLTGGFGTFLLHSRACIFEFDSDSFGSFRLAQRALDEGWLLLTMDDRFIGGIVVVDGR